MTTPQRIEQLKKKGKERILREESRNLDVTRVGPLKSFMISEDEFDAILLQIQDEQKEICAEEAYIEYDFRGNEDVNREAIREAPYAYNPKQETT